MNKTNIYFLILISLIIPSCSSDDDNNESNTDGSIIGLWEIESATFNGQTEVDTETVFFMNDNTVRFDYVGNDFGNATWTKSGTQLVMDFGDPEPFVVEILELTDNRLQWREEDNGGILIETFTKQ
ncbi:hypothetical protein F0365_03055 [Nonlabens sp. Ci31]|jgi:hypothetical protein|uniref:lipocalin family protein n=1 Tax=Nonlabens sp. Ci31 TaxID=2608253 RepID=UPI001462A449|nr:lipocalin family protein [Nonlabens sp. Ci31]QJP33457.1 hypothetical protein F0365_03055 [Nonlabens sp. Ci31]